MVCVAARRLARSCMSASASRAAAGKSCACPWLTAAAPARRRLFRAAALPPPGSSAARMSARCTARTAGPPPGAGGASRLSPPPMCSRHDGSTAVTTSAPVARMFAHLSLSMASETPAFLTEKVPPKPQHSVASGSSSSSRPRTLASSRCGASPMRVTRCEWQVGCRVTRRGYDAPTSSTQRRRTRNSENSKSLPPSSSASRASCSCPASRATCGRSSRTHPTHEDDGETTASTPSSRLITSTNRRASRKAWSRYPLFTCIWPQHV